MSESQDFCYCPLCNAKHRKSVFRHWTPIIHKTKHRCPTCSASHKICTTLLTDKLEKEKRNEELVLYFTSNKVTYQDCADKYNITRERVRQILNLYGIKSEYSWVSPKLPPLTPEQKRQKQLDKFWAKAKREENGCLVWQGRRVVSRFRLYSEYYGDGKANNRRVQVVAWVLTHKRKPTGWVVNTCGNSLCINPEHLVDTDPATAMRLVRPQVTSYSLTDFQVEMIRELIKTHTIDDTANIVGVSKTTVCSIKWGKTHIITERQKRFKKKLEKIAPIVNKHSKNYLMKTYHIGDNTINKLRAGEYDFLLNG